MRLKKYYYDTTRTMVFTFVLYEDDLGYLEKNHPRLLQIVGNQVQPLDAMDGLILVAKKLEDRFGKIRGRQDPQNQAEQEGVGVRPVQPDKTEPA